MTTTKTDIWKIFTATEALVRTTVNIQPKAIEPFNHPTTKNSNMVGIDKTSHLQYLFQPSPLIHMTNKYFEIIKKTTVNYIENKISVEVFEETFQKLDEIEIYKNLENDGYKSVSNFVSAVQEIDDLGALKSQWIVKIIDLFYAYFTDNYDYVYSKDFYKFFKFGLNKETKNPVKISFKQAIQNYLNKKISSECLAYTANEFLNNLKFFQEEINKDKELSNLLNMSLKLKFNKFLEDLNPKETQTKKTIDNVLKTYIKNN